MLEGTCHCGDVSWTLRDLPESATACNCTVCRRYGVLWAYGYIDDDIRSVGKTNTYRRNDGGDIDFHFCANCGCVTHYIRTAAGEGGRHRTAVNLRLTDPGPIFDLPMDHFDGHKTFKDLPRDARTVRDMWF
ncbi:GFA family protein [Roseovarius aestuarii]|uniref:Glutathione-dependent formaldehyde-activating enzyme n=1 Tax=Roseovarius aestuarii TaxID=475083 RepID=A0A1X7BYM0_9RHOB|nr:GFA family protein [Roseovarius aestuarii]SMC14672.1 Glutathione-dependent formaldehyde-activating enzyme [Roseovarius aestuarii]